MLSGAETKNRALLVVIAASSEDTDQPGPPAFLRPIMGRSSLDHLLDATKSLSPDGITLVVFGNGAGDVLPESGKAGGISVIAGAGDPSALIDDLMEKIRGFEGDVLFIPGTLVPCDALLLPDFVAYYREQTGTPCRTIAVTRDGRRHTRLFITEASRIEGSIGTAGGHDLAFEDRIFSIFEHAARDTRVRDFVPREPRRLWDAACPRDFAAATRAYRTAVVERLMDSGVTIVDPDRTYVDWDVVVGPGSTIYPDTYLEGKTTLGSCCIVEPNVRITDSEIADLVTVKMCTVITESIVERGVQIGPFAHIRPKSRLCEEAKVGNFVEVKKSTVGRGSKASHLSYIGDAHIGQQVNVGAGTITCNYDGVNKHITTIGDGVFIGSDTQFVAPVVVGEYSLIGAGSTITRDVPPNALAVSRAKQVNIPDRGVKSRKEKK